MFIKRIPVGQLEVNCLIISDGKSESAMVVDPGDEPDRILDIAKENNLNVEKIVCTHTHFDHIGALPELREATGAEIYMHKEELSVYKTAGDMAAMWGFQIESLPQPDVFLNEGDSVSLGELNFEVLHTPGHTPGGICLYKEGLVITGDTLFATSVGRTDLPGGSMQKLMESFKRLMALPEDTRVLPGHGPETNIGHERRFNLFAGEL